VCYLDAPFRLSWNLEWSVRVITASARIDRVSFTT